MCLFHKFSGNTKCHLQFEISDQSKHREKLMTNLNASLKQDQIFGQVINRIGNIADFGQKQGKAFGKRAVHPIQFFRWEY